MILMRLTIPWTISADLVARWGGDEFALIVNSGRSDAEEWATACAARLSGSAQSAPASKSVSVTVEPSIGVVEWNGSESGPELLARADYSMYRGKHIMKTPRTA
jgi:diguanylate cyclase (GGDEF)-like protein